MWAVSVLRIKSWDQAGLEAGVGYTCSAPTLYQASCAAQKQHLCTEAWAYRFLLWG